MPTTALTSHNVNYNPSQLNNNHHHTLRASKDVPILNYQEHPLLIAAEEKMTAADWDKETRQMVLDIFSENNSHLDEESYHTLLNTDESKDNFIKLMIANSKGERITKDNIGHLLSNVEEKEVDDFKESIAGTLKASPEKNELLLKNGTYGLAQQLQADRWDAKCCDKVMKLVNAMWDGCLTDTVSDKEFPPNAVNNANLQENINNHFSKRKDRHTLPTIDKNQFLRLLLAAKNQQVTSSPSRAAIQELQTAIEKALADCPLASQQALVPTYNPFANTEKITFERIEYGRSFSEMTPTQKATYLLRLTSAAKEIVPPTLSKPDTRAKAHKAGNTGVVPVTNKDKNPFTPIPETCKAGYTDNTPKIDNNAHIENIGNIENYAVKTAETLVAATLGTIYGGAITGLGIVTTSLLSPATGAVINFNTKARADQIENDNKLKVDMLKSIEDNFEVDISDPPGDMMRNALLQAYRWPAFSHNADERLDNDRIKLSVGRSFFPAVYAYQAYKGTVYEKEFTPTEIASGEARKYIEEHSSPIRNILKIGFEYTWPADYPTFLITTLRDGDILSIVEDKVDAAVKDPENIRKIKQSLRGTADVMADIYNLTHPNSPFGQLTKADLDNVQQLVFQESTLSNLFLHKGYICSISPGFEPVNFNRLMRSLFTPMPKELRDEIDLGLSFSHRVEHDGKDKVLIPKKAVEIKKWIHGLVPGKMSGKVEDVLIKPAIDNIDSNFDFATRTRWESNVFRGAETLKAVLAFFPIWGPAMKITPLVNYGISLLGCSPSIIKAVIEENPNKQKKHITDALFALATNTFAGSSSTLNAPAIKNLASKAAQAIAKYPQGKLDVIAKFMKAAGVLAGNKAKGGIKNVADFWNSLNQGQKMLMARVLGNSGKLFNDKLAKLFADENKGTTVAAESTSASSTTAAASTSSPTASTPASSATASTSASSTTAPPKQYYFSKKGQSLEDIAFEYKGAYENARDAFWETNKDKLSGKPFLTDILPESTQVEMPDYNKYGLKPPAQ